MNLTEENSDYFGGVLHGTAQKRRRRRRLPLTQFCNGSVQWFVVKGSVDDDMYRIGTHENCKNAAHTYRVTQQELLRKGI